jgi:hypothetical protein
MLYSLSYEITLYAHSPLRAALLTLPDIADTLKIYSLYYVIVHENEARGFPNVNIRGKQVIEESPRMAV